MLTYITIVSITIALIYIYAITIKVIVKKGVYNYSTILFALFAPISLIITSLLLVVQFSSDKVKAIASGILLLGFIYYFSPRLLYPVTFVLVVTIILYLLGKIKTIKQEKIDLEKH